LVASLIQSSEAMLSRYAAKRLATSVSIFSFDRAGKVALDVEPAERVADRLLNERDAAPPACRVLRRSADRGAANAKRAATKSRLRNGAYESSSRVRR
jgi:hypothetical protein